MGAVFLMRTMKHRPAWRSQLLLMLVVAAAYKVAAADAAHVDPFVGTWENDSKAINEQTRAVIGVSADVAATLSPGKRAPGLERFEPRSGRKLVAAPLSSNGGSLSVAGKTVVFSSGRRFWVLDAQSRRRRFLAAAAAHPVAHSVEGRRVALAENFKTTARVRAPLLP
jgi:hypothetical protein